MEIREAVLERPGVVDLALKMRRWQNPSDCEKEQERQQYRLTVKASIVDQYEGSASSC